MYSPAGHLWIVLRRVFPVWLGIVIISVVWGMTVETLPGLMTNAVFAPGTDWYDNLAYYDVNLDVIVAEEGYGWEGRELQTSVILPLYPFAMRSLSTLSGIRPAFSAFLLNKISLLIGLSGLWLLVAYLHDEDFADRAVMYVAFSLLGTGFVWIMSYREPFYLMLWVFGLLLFFKREHYLAGLVTVLAVWVRPQGVLLLPTYGIILLERWHAGDYDSLWDRRLWRDGLLSCGPPLIAFSAWMLHISNITQRPYSLITAQSAYARKSATLPWVRVWEYLRTDLQPGELQWGNLFEVWHLIFVFVASAILLWMAYQQRLSWGIVFFSIASVALGLSTAVYAVGRYALLTWLPLALIYVVPRRYDMFIVPVAAFLSIIALVVLGVGLSPGYVP